MFNAIKMTVVDIKEDMIQNICKTGRICNVVAVKYKDGMKKIKERNATDQCCPVPCIGSGQKSKISQLDNTILISGFPSAFLFHLVRYTFLKLHRQKYLVKLTNT